MQPRLFSLVLAITISLITGTSSEANLLLNPSFEAGTSVPSNWNLWGSGTFIWNTTDAHSGSKSAELGGASNFMMA